MSAHNIVIIHGIGTGGSKYADPFKAAIAREFDRTITRILGRVTSRDVASSDTRASRALRFEVVDWSQVTQVSQNSLLDVMGMRNRWNLFRRLRLTRLFRQNMVDLLGDVIAYEGGEYNAVYKAIHTAVTTSVDRLSEASAAERDSEGVAPLTIIGHSLGSVIGSDYVWDNTRSTAHSHILGEKHFSLFNFISMGSPLALYALRNNAYGTPASIRDSLPAPIKVLPDYGLWLNLVDPQDAIAFPLEPIRSYSAAGVIDRTIHAGSWATGWTPLSHVGYWKCTDAATWIGRKLALDWARLHSPAFAAERLAQEWGALKQDLRRK